MRGEKENPYNFSWKIIKDWAWSFPEYTFQIDRPLEDISFIVIDPTGYMADVNRNNNEYFKQDEIEKEGQNK